MKLPVLLHAPHRAMFLAGVVQLLAALAWWSVELALRWDGGPMPQWPAYAGWLHALWLIYGVLPFFMFGFLMTAMPRWQGAAPTELVVYASVAALCSAGWLLFWAALRWPLLLPASLALSLAGWGLAWRELLRVALHPHSDRRAPQWLVAALGFGMLGLTCVFVWTLSGRVLWLRAAVDIGLWFYAMPVFVIVSHRMIPFFSGAVLPRYEVVRPAAALYLMLLASFGHGALALLGLTPWQWLPDAIGAAAALWLSWRWGLRASLAVPMLAFLHLAFLWLGIGLLLSAGQGAARLAGYEVLGLAPIHAITIGFFSSMLLGMVTRVTRGHAGRDLNADRLTLAAYAVLQGLTLLRIVAELVPTALAAPLLSLTIFAMLAVFAAWAVRYAPAYWRPRSDGRPG